LRRLSLSPELLQYKQQRRNSPGVKLFNAQEHQLRHLSVTHVATPPATSENSPEHNATSLRLSWSSFQIPHPAVTLGEGFQGEAEVSVWIMEWQGNYHTE